MKGAKKKEGRETRKPVIETQRKENASESLPKMGGSFPTRD